MWLPGPRGLTEENPVNRVASLLVGFRRASSPHPVLGLICGGARGCARRSNHTGSRLATLDSRDPYGLDADGDGYGCE